MFALWFFFCLCTFVGITGCVCATRDINRSRFDKNKIILSKWILSFSFWDQVIKTVENANPKGLSSTWIFQNNSTTLKILFLRFFASCYPQKPEFENLKINRRSYILSNTLSISVTHFEDLCINFSSITRPQMLNTE